MVRVFKLFLGGFLGFTLASGIILSSSKIFAEDVKVSDVSVAVPSSCEISGVGTNSHSANVNNGTYEEGIGKTTLTVFCNDGGGYTIYAVGYTGEEIGGTNSTKLIGEDLGLAIDTGLYTQGTTVNSVWSMKVDKVTDSSVSYSPANLTIENGFNNYHVVPATYTKVATFTSTTDLTLGSKLETTYAAYVSGTQRADVYNGKVKYTLVHPASNIPNTEQACSANTICYWPNAGNTVVDSMGDQTANYSDNTDTITSNMDVNLWPSNYQRSGYGFVGWSDKYDWELNANDASGNGTGNNAGYHIYGPMANINVGDVSTKGLSLYAVWAPSAGSLQGWNSCSSLGQGRVTALTDLRDNDTYAVAKLADGKCWMIENLRLDNTPELSASNTNNPALPLTNIYNATNPITSNHLSVAVDPTVTAWCKTSNTNCDDQSMLATNNTVPTSANANNTTTPDMDIYSYGNYYNWYSATAGNGTYSLSSGDVIGDLCPTNWQLPIGSQTTTAKSFGALSVALGGPEGGAAANTNSTPTGAEMSKTFRSYPNNFLYSGATTDSSINYRGTYGHYWSSTARNNFSGHYFLIGSVSANPAINGNYKYNGRPIRCVVDN